MVFTAFDAADGSPVPRALIDATLNVYVVPCARPLMICLVTVELNVLGACATDPTNGVTTYPVTAEPFVFAGAVHDTVACASPGTADTPVGATGAPTVTSAEGADCGPIPRAFFAATLK